MNLQPVIVCVGSGARLWRLSRDRRAAKRREFPALAWNMVDELKERVRGCCMAASRSASWAGNSRERAAPWLPLPPWPSEPEKNKGMTAGSYPREINQQTDG